MPSDFDHGPGDAARAPGEAADGRPACILIIDPDDYTSGVLAGELQGFGYRDLRFVRSALELPAALAAGEPDLTIFNFHSGDPASLAHCSTVRLLAPGLSIAVLTARGPALREVQRWREQTGSVDVIVEKPIAQGPFRALVDKLVSSQRRERASRIRSQQLARMVPDGALEAAADAGSRARGELIEAAILFTDIRRSTELAVSLAPRELFVRLNKSLSAQGQTIRAAGGSVIKYTGDGLMAAFRGSGRAHLALRCAILLQSHDAQAAAELGLRLGVGVAEGAVLAGLIGDAERPQYDLIGATVHLAARLCAKAEPGQVICTRHLLRASGIAAPPARDAGEVAIRGFGQPVHCMAFDSSTPPDTTGAFQ